nr:hypothetical protein Iba_chr09aCG13570 [Ipomoea batatas]
MKKAQKNVLLGIALLLISSICEAVGLNVVNEGNQPTDTRNIDVVCYTWRYCVHFCDGIGAPYCINWKCYCGNNPPLI